MSPCPPNSTHSIQKGACLELSCIQCGAEVQFSVIELGDSDVDVRCPSCGKAYIFDDAGTKRQLLLFSRLCQQIRESEEILSDTAVSVDLGPHNVKVPYKLLLTRLTSQLSLDLDGQQTVITFRIEPSKDVPSGAHESTQPNVKS